MAPKASSDSKGKQKALRIEETPEWYTLVPALAAPAKPPKAPTAAQLSDAQTRAGTLHAELLAAHSDLTNDASADGAFLQKVLKGGTLSDRLSALTLLAQASPLHHTRALDALKAMAERGRGGGRDQSLKALRCVVDWWVGGGAPARKLKYFREQPVTHPDVTDRHLVIWYFEDWLKKYFFSILQILEALSLDPLQYVRMQAISFISTLLRERPEQEHNLLRLLVNKLGDTERTVCARVSHHLLQLLQAHPVMKAIVIREAAALVLRAPSSTPATAPGAKATHIRFGDDGKPLPAGGKTDAKGKAKAKDAKPAGAANPHAAYYVTVTLNQFVLSPAPADRQVARQLIDIYFTFFQELLGDADSTDVDAKREEEVDDDVEPEGGAGRPYKGGRAGAKGKGKARAPNATDGAGFTEVEDARSRHVSAILTGVNRALPFAKLTMADVGFSKHIDTLFLITHTSTFNISLQALLLLQHITSALRGDLAVAPLVDRFYRTLYSSLHDPRLAGSAKHALYLNLVFRAVKADPSPARAAAFVRRFAQVLAAGASGGPEFAAGGLYLLGELFSTVRGLRQLISTPANKLGEGDEGAYDPRKREPLHAHATALPLWELTPLLQHYHPAVALHAHQLLSAQPLTASPDLALNTLTHFLDRFVYKNPKQARAKGSSAMQPGATPADGSGVKRVRGEVADPGGLVNEAAFARRREEDVPVDQRFFHKYFVRKREQERRAGRKSAGEDGDDKDEDEDTDAAEDAAEALVEGADEAADSESDEAEIWEAMKSSMPRAEGDDDLLLDADADDDSEDGGFDLDDDSEVDLDDGEGATASAAEESESDASPMSDMDDEEDLGLAEHSDAEDLLDLDADVPVGLISLEGSDAASDAEAAGGDEWGGVTADASAGSKRKRVADERKAKRRKLRSLPTFASAEDYAKLIDEAPEENI